MKTIRIITVTEKQKRYALEDFISHIRSKLMSKQVMSPQKKKQGGNKFKEVLSSFKLSNST